MTKVQLSDFVNMITTGLKQVLASKSQVELDMNALKAELKAYSSSVVETGTGDLASTTYVTEAVQAVNEKIGLFQTGLDEKIKTTVSALGTFVGAESTYASLPTIDKLNKPINAGDFSHLTVNDGNHKKGLYRYDGSTYLFITGDPAVLEVFASLKYTNIDDTDDSKFITGKYLLDRENSNQLTQAEVDAAIASA